MKRTITLYYDVYEKELGDGFYPITEYKKGFDKTMIVFEFCIDMYWKQRYNIFTCICGLKGDSGEKLLAILNENDNQYTGIGIKNSFGKILYTKQK